MSPCARAIWVIPAGFFTRSAAMIAPPPMNTSAKVPTNSATKCRYASRMRTPIVSGAQPRTSLNLFARAPNVIHRFSQDDKQSSVCSAKYEGRVDAAEAERIAQCVLNSRRPPFSRDVVEIAVVVGGVEIDRRGEPAALERKRANRGLERAGCAERVTVVALGAAHLQLTRVVSKDLLERQRLRRIVEGCRAAVGVDVFDVGRRDVAIGERAPHRPCSL